MTDIKRWRIEPGSKVRLDDIPTHEDGGLDRDQGREQHRAQVDQIRDLQERLYASGKHALLIVLQAMDTAGKDSTINSVFGPINPQGCRVTSFKAPSSIELSHDYLWRIHQAAPARGMIGVFNRSHYEDVLIARVKKLASHAAIDHRYDHINAFENMLVDEGTVIIKFYLHISKAYQKKRLERRLARPDKHWKFNPADIEERALWKDYQRAYEIALERCSTPRAPWYVIPAERRWFRNLLVSRIIRDALQDLNLKYPEATFDPKAITID